MLGYCGGEIRLPLVRISDDYRNKLRQELVKYGGKICRASSRVRRVRRDGRAILNGAEPRPCAGRVRHESSFFGRDAAAVLNRDAFNVMVSAISVDDVSRCDSVIDFSSPAASMRLLAAADAKRPLVIGDGIHSRSASRNRRAGRDIPVLSRQTCRLASISSSALPK